MTTLKNLSLTFFEKETREKVFLTIAHVDDKLGAWLRGQILLSVIIGVVSFLGLTLLQIPYALPLALMAGILEVVPTIGPILGIGIGANLLGIAGALLIVPFISFIIVLYNGIMKSKEKADTH